MTEKISKDQFLEELLKMLIDLDGTSEFKQKWMKEIHSLIDHDMLNGLSQWLASQAEVSEPRLKVGAVMSTLSYALAHEIVMNSESDEEACKMLQLYGDYIHTAGHTIAVKTGKK